MCCHSRIVLDAENRDSRYTWNTRRNLNIGRRKLVNIPFFGEFNRNSHAYIESRTKTHLQLRKMEKNSFLGYFSPKKHTFFYLINSYKFQYSTYRDGTYTIFCAFFPSSIVFYRIWRKMENFSKIFEKTFFFSSKNHLNRFFSYFRWDFEEDH